MRRLISCLLVIFSALSVSFIAAEGPVPDGRGSADTLLAQGNFAEAYDLLSSRVLGKAELPGRVADDFTKAVKCLTQLNRQDEIDSFREKAVARHGDNWRLLLAAAKSLDQGETSGHQVAGEFVRGHGGRCQGPNVTVRARDRVRALQLLVQAFPSAGREKDRAVLGPFYKQLADLLMDNRSQGGSWRLQYLTDLTQRPDYDDQGETGTNLRAPVDEKGDPLFHSKPADWASAKSDGERWRWALSQAEKADPSLAPSVKRQFADFLSNQFGVETMAEYQWFFGRSGETDETRRETGGIWQVHTLGEDETIARLAGGIKRFKLPPDFNYIAMYKDLKAYDRLAEIFENRRQYPRAAECWRKVPPGKPFQAEKRLRQIVSPWGEFESAGAQAAGLEPRVDFRFRNGRHVHFEARAINVEGLLNDVKAYLKSNPSNLDWDQVNIENFGYRLVTKGGDKYLGKRVASWDLALDPRPNHFDRRTTVKLPFRKGGAYLLTARMKDGNTTRIILWLADLALVEKPVKGGRFYFLADAQTGRPAGPAQLDLFGYRHDYVNVPRGKDRHQVSTKDFVESFDAQGQLVVAADRLGNDYQWMAIARAGDRKTAFLGFDYYWAPRREESAFDKSRAFIITDRPVYRPNQTVRFKVWADQARYDREGRSPFAGKSFSLEIHDPAGNKLVEKSYTADEFGGFSGEWPLEENAKLGGYAVRAEMAGKFIGQISFRVEEYKKPEFEVNVEAPEESVPLGERVTAKISAAYYFGAPVTDAKVKYKVLRSNHDVRWYPAGPWDWYYGRGYGWMSPDYPWWPGWRDWGCERPSPWWWRDHQKPPELVAEGEAPIGPEGTFELPIDTSLALAVHPDQDHRYEIAVEVTDRSRRTIVGQESVLVTRKPFKVYAWVDRGHYETGDTIQAQFTAQTADQKPIADAAARAVLYRVSYDATADQAKETSMEEWKLKTDAEGRLHVKIKAPRPGQYRLVGTVTDGKQRTIAGGCVFVVRGEAEIATGYRFNDLELVPDRPTYAPGETARLMVNAAQPDSHVLLFLRPSDGLYEKPELLMLDGQSSLKEIAIQKGDMPNFFVEAVTVRGGKIHTETREIIVPPENRILNVEAIPSAKTYKPGQKADFKFRVTDQAGKPFQGSLALSVYDKSVEYISGGSNVGDIREYFWKWRREHYPSMTCNLSRESYPVHPSGEETMAFLGVFGQGVADDVTTKGGGLETRGDGAGSDSKLNESPSFALMAPQAIPSEGFVARKAPEPAMLVAPVVRRQFADTAHWVARLDTDARGEGRTQFTLPDNLTTWKARVWAMGDGARCGEGTADIVTAKKLLLRLQAPRFFVQKDEVVLSANVHNYLAGTKKVRVSLELEGETLEIISPAKDQDVRIPSRGEQRVDWRVRVIRPGEAVVRMTALTDEESDAAEMRFPVHVHGMLKTESFCGAIRPLQTAGSLDFRVPKERRPEESKLEIRYSPSLALAMVDALPYLVDYPYGCTEQTLNRFLPTIITQRTLQRLGVRLSDIREKITNLNAQEIGEDAKRRADWKRLAGEKRWDGENWVERNPVYDEGKAEDMAKAGVEKLTAMQNEDGGWGWFSGSEERSYPHTTAQVVHGLQIARANGVAFDPAALKRGTTWLERYQTKRVDHLAKVSKKKEANASADDLDAFVYMALTDEKRENPRMREFLYRDRTGLSVYAKALFGLGLHAAGRIEERDMLIRNIRQYLVQDDENQTAHLRLGNEGYWWHWYGSEMEAHAYFLKLLSLTDPKGDAAPRLVKYMLNNRRHAAYWNSTRDTALVVEAFADYLKAAGEDRPDMTVEIQLDGRTLKKVAITPENLFTYDNKLVVKGADLADGARKININKTGAGPLYWNAYLTNFTLEDPIEKAGLEIKVDRAYFKLVPQEKSVKDAGSRGQAVDRKVEKYKRIPLKNMDELKSGDRVLVELTVESKNDYEYIVLEDPKPAGFEPIELQSGYDENGAYVEFRDERVALFLRTLSRGRRSLSYELRAEIPGRFSALPTQATAMYAPELRANSDGLTLRVSEGTP